MLHEVIRSHPLATLVTSGGSGLLANLIPFTLVEDHKGRKVLRSHLARANDQLADLQQGHEVLVVFQGPQAYVSPSWYPTKQQHGRVVPTWNYIAVQVSGWPTVVEDADWLRTQLDSLTEQQERAMPQPWAVGDAPEPFVAGQIGGIIGLEIPIERIAGKWKASQNQPSINRNGVVAGLRKDGACPSLADIVETFSPSK